MPEQNKIKYSFPSSVTISDCAAILETLGGIMQDNQHQLILDATQVEHVDTAGVQLMVSICHQQFNQQELKDCLSMSDSLKLSMQALGL